MMQIWVDLCPIHTADTDTTQLSSWVASAVCIEFATSSWHLPTKIWKLNMLRIYLVEFSCRRCVHTHQLSWPSLQFCSLYVTGAENWKLGHDWRLVRSHCRHNATRLRCRQIVQTRRQLSCVGIDGVYWALGFKTHGNNQHGILI